MTQLLPERRRMQRDWGGHTIFAAITAVVSIIGTSFLIGYPLLSWSRSVDKEMTQVTERLSLNTSIVSTLQAQGAELARLKDRQENTDRSIGNLQTFQATVTSLLSETNTKIGVLTQSFEDSLKERKK